MTTKIKCPVCGEYGTLTLKTTIQSERSTIHVSKMVGLPPRRETEMVLLVKGAFRT